MTQFMNILVGNPLYPQYGLTYLHLPDSKEKLCPLLTHHINSASLEYTMKDHDLWNSNPGKNLCFPLPTYGA